ncbi:hypothetical protein NYA9BBAC_02595 [Salinibacterium sp. NYA9b]
MIHSEARGAVAHIYWYSYNKLRGINKAKELSRYSGTVPKKTDDQELRSMGELALNTSLRNFLGSYSGGVTRWCRGCGSYEHGAPKPSVPGVACSASYARSHVAVAVASVNEIGLDIEDRLNDRQERDIWARSEAALKSCAVGIRWLDALELKPHLHATINIHGQEFQRELYEISPWPGMSAYVAVAPSIGLVITHINGDLYDWRNRSDG